MYAKYFKRILDFVLSLIAFVILIPLIIIIYIAIKIDSKGPAFFLQERLGKNGKVFKIIKFRTMIVDAEKQGIRVTGENDKRITKIGKILRDTSLDEIPQLINIIKGDMSLIGPRPPVTYFPYKYEEYTDEKIKRFNVRPGVTGLAQIRVRNNATWDKRIEIDVEYVNNITFLNDLKIFFITIKKVIFRENIYEQKKEKESENIHIKEMEKKL